MHNIITALRLAFSFTSPAIYPRKAEMAVPRIKGDLDFVASRYIEVVTAITLVILVDALFAVLFQDVGL
jgi:hypothetical protein